MTHPAADMTLLYADEALLVLNKPAGLLSVPGRGADKQDCLSTRVQRHDPQARVVHRLDMATSGLLLMARSAAVQRQLSLAFAARAVQKHYEAVVCGLLLPTDPGDAQGWSVIDLPILLDWPRRGKPSSTRWRVLSTDTAADTTRLALMPVTGRSHQLRVHLQAMGHPVLGDALYAPTAVQALAPRLLLHASGLALAHPVSGQPMRFECPPPF